MLTTAEAARTKWCPFARTWALDSGAVNRSGLGKDDWPHCIADDCMLWEWRNQPANDAKRVGCCGLAVLPLSVSQLRD